VLMPRTAYYAPGVYVEEVPSARQPIAGVGTNTVGFIGQVDDQITYPEPNDNYDPVLARLTLDLAAIAKADQTKISQEDQARKADLENQIKTLEKRNEDLSNKLIPDLDQKIAAERQKPLEQQDAQQLEKLDKQRNRLAAELEGNKKTIDVEKKKKEGGTVSDDMDEGSNLKPYILRTFDVKVAPYDTKLCTSFSEYVKLFGPFSAYKTDDKGNSVPIHPGHNALTHAVNGFFNNGGTRCFVARVGKEYKFERIKDAFESIDEVAIIAAPGLEAGDDIWGNLTTYAETHENVFAILDCPAKVEDENGDLDVKQLSYANTQNSLPGPSKDAAYYFPYIEVIDEAKQLQDADPARQVPAKYRGRTYVPPSGHIAGIYARTDEERGVHKAPANAVVRGALEVKYYVSRAKQELLNPQGVNCIRNMNGNIAVWGARTIGGDKNCEWKYVNVRRLFLFLQESIDEGTQWVVFEPNEPGLWAKIRLNVSAFLTNVWRSGALFGLTPEEAFYVKCDEETNPPEVRDLGMVVTEIGVAIVRPAEFVIFRISQSTGQRSS
jgi:phage tail sheath protein FI